MMSSRKIGIATVLFNSREVLPDFFRSLAAQTYGNFAVYAVDNASTDGSATMCREQGEHFIVTENKDNTGFAHATNQGIRQALDAGCEAILILNNDVIFEGGFLAELMASLQNSRVDLAAPLTYYADRPDVIWAAGGTLQRLPGYRPIHRGIEQKDSGQFSSRCRIQFAPGSCILARADVFKKIGMLDETYFTYWEDTDFAVRAWKAGLYSEFVPSAKLWHKVSSLAGLNSPFQRYYAVRNHALYIRRHCSPLHASLLSKIYLAWYRICGLRNGSTDDRVAVWKEGWRLGEEAPQRSLDSPTD